MSATIKCGDVVRIKPEWQDPGDDRFIWRALEDEDGGRVMISPTNTGLAIPPNQVVTVEMIEVVQSQAAPAKAQHTPGPWHTMPFKGGETIYAADNHRVAECLATGKHGERHEANARLIAAAPELLAALERTLNLFVESHADELMSNHNGDGQDCSYCRQTDAARAAIAKATGGAK